jgi:hypothetical protein
MSHNGTTAFTYKQKYSSNRLPVEKKISFSNSSFILARHDCLVKVVGQYCAEANWSGGQGREMKNFPIFPPCCTVRKRFSALQISFLFIYQLLGAYGVLR